MLKDQFVVNAPRIEFTGLLLDRRGYTRAGATIPAFRLGVEPPNKGMKLPPEVLTTEEVYALLRACGCGRAGSRNRALLVMLWRGGLRISEALDLMPKDVDLQRGELRVLHGKGDKDRLVALDPEAAAVMQLWEAERQRLQIPRSKPYFCVVSTPNVGDHIHSAYVRELCKRLAVRAGIEKRVHPHGLRHTYASFLLDNGVDIHHIQRMLGHRSIATTERYANHINPRRSLDAVRAVPWPDLSRINS